jgi:hypothetical protein
MPVLEGSAASPPRSMQCIIIGVAPERRLRVNMHVNTLKKKLVIELISYIF